MDDEKQTANSDLPGPTTQAAEQTAAAIAEVFSQAGNVESATESVPSTMTSSTSASQQSSAWLTQAPTEATLPENLTEASDSTTTSQVSPTLQQRSQSPAATAPESSSVASSSVPSSEDTAVSRTTSLCSANDDPQIHSVTFPREFPSPAVAVSDSGNTASMTAFSSDVPTETVPRPAENDRSASAPACSHENPIAAEVAGLDNTASEIASSLGATGTIPPSPPVAAAAAAAEAISTVTASAFVQHSTGSMEDSGSIYQGWTLQQTGQSPPTGSIQGSGSRYPSESSPVTRETESPLTIRRIISSMATSTQPSSLRAANLPPWSSPVWQQHTNSADNVSNPAPTEEKQTLLPNLLRIVQEQCRNEGMPVTQSPEWGSPAMGRAIMGRPCGNSDPRVPSQRDESSLGQNPPSFSGDCNDVDFPHDFKEPLIPWINQSRFLPHRTIRRSGQTPQNDAFGLVSDGGDVSSPQYLPQTEQPDNLNQITPQDHSAMAYGETTTGVGSPHDFLGYTFSDVLKYLSFCHENDDAQSTNVGVQVRQGEAGSFPAANFSSADEVSQNQPPGPQLFVSTNDGLPQNLLNSLNNTAPHLVQFNGTTQPESATHYTAPQAQADLSVPPPAVGPRPLQPRMPGSVLSCPAFVHPRPQFSVHYGMTHPSLRSAFPSQPGSDPSQYGIHLPLTAPETFLQNQFGSLSLEQGTCGVQPFHQGTFGIQPCQPSTFASQPLQQGAFGSHFYQQGSFGSLQQGSFASQPLQQGTFGSRPLQQDSFSSQTLQQGTFTSQHLEQSSLGFQPHQQGTFSFRPLQPSNKASVSIHQGENGSASRNSGVQAAPPSQSSGSWQSPRFPRSSQRSESFRKPKLHRLSTASEAPTKTNGAEESTAASTPKELQEVPSWDCDIALVLKDANRGSFKPGSKPPTADVHIARRYRLVPKWQSNLIVQNSFVEFFLKFLPLPRPQPYRVTRHTATAFQNPIPYFLVHPVVGTPQYDPDMQPLNWSDLVDGLRICITMPDATTMEISPSQTNNGNNNNNNCIMSYTFDQVGRYTINVLLRGHHVMGSPWVMHSCVKRTLKPDEVEDIFILNMNQLPNNRKLHGVCLDPHTERTYLPDRNTSSIFSYHLASDTVDNPPICPLDSNGVPMLLQPTDVSMSPDGQIYVCDKAGHRVRVLDRQGRVLGTYSGLQTTWGVSCASDGRVAIANFSSNRNGDLHIIDTDDGTICVLPLLSQNPRKPLFMPSGGLLLADFEKMALMEIYVDGIKIRKMTRRYDLKSYGKPSGLAVDASGNVILSMGRSCTLVYFTAGGGDRTVYYDNPVIKDFSSKLPAGTSFGGVTVTKDGYIVVVLEDHDKTTRPPHRLLVIQPGVDTPQGRPLLGGKK